MSKHIETIPLSSIERIAIVLGNGRLAPQVKQDTGANIVINFGFFSGKKPTHHMKVDGTVLAQETWGCWGYAWDVGPDIKMETIPAPAWRNYVAGLELISPMTREIGLQYDRNGELGGVRGRTALALKSGCLITYCSNDGKDATTLDNLQAELLGMGAESAVYGDGGGSSQGAGDGWEVKSSDNPPRAVFSYLCIWIKNEIKEDKPVSKTVCLDPGHGPGCVNGAPDGSYKEYEFAWDMGQRVKAHLERCGVKVVMTKDEKGYPELTERADVSNKAVADLFVSLHTNAEGNAGWGTAQGFLIYTSSGPETAARNVAAKKIIAMAQAAGLLIKGTGLLHETYTVLTKTNAPAVLIEYGFHTNKEDVALLKTAEYRTKLAEATAKGACDFLGVSWVDEPKNEGNPSGEADWASEAWAKAKAKCIMDGTRPTEPVTRQELAVVLYRLNLI